jgi:diguanylate cyclase (GGDEF)-like protein
MAHPPLVDRLAAHLRSTPDAERPIAGRVGGSLWLVAAVATALLPFFPQSDEPLLPWIAIIAGAAGLWGVTAIVLIDWRRAPDWLIPLANGCAVLFTGVVTQITGGVDSPARLYTFLALIYAACFVTFRQACWLILGCAMVWALPVVDDRTPGAAAGELAMVLPIFAAVGAVLLGGRRLLTAMRESAESLSEEHHALRSIATSVAAGHPPETVCDHAAEQAARLLRGDGAGILRYDPDDHVTLVGSWARNAPQDGPGTRFPILPGSELAAIRTDQRHVRVDDVSHGRRAEEVRELDGRGYSAWAGSPIRVRGQLWGVLCVTASTTNSLPADASEHLAEFAELVGMAIANTEEAARLTADATSDPLTGLANHRAFQERLRSDLARADRHDRPLALALIDIDDFKGINDAGGHAVGDEVLCAVAGHLREHLRTGDILARVGGDEFAVLLPEARDADAVAALERARQAIERADFAGGARVTISVGVCDIAHAVDAEALSRFADGALYWSKEHGRNQVSVYHPETIHELSAAERLSELQRSQALVGIRALARAIDARDVSTREHSERVAALTARLAEQCGWRPERVALLHEAALVHDVGKIGIPDAILLKPSRLTPEEYEVIKTHSELGARIVEDVLDAEQVEWILGHHERPDGGGYPRGLTSDALSEGAALLAAADAFDVMVSARPYSPGRSVADALAECRELVGRQFTATAVAALEGVHAPAGGVHAPAAPLAAAA